MEGRKAAAVFVTSPTYHGICSNLTEISKLCHSHGIPLIVDEAHGAHLGFHPSCLIQPSSKELIWLYSPLIKFYALLRSHRCYTCQGIL
jgi:arginine/lysine/ornithine decarboxylase